MHADDIRVIILGALLVIGVLGSMVRKPVVKQFYDWFPPADLYISVPINDAVCYFKAKQTGYETWEATQMDPNCGKIKHGRP